MDAFNLESNALLNEKFYFDYAWKGRSFLVIFLALFFLEWSVNAEKIEISNKIKRLKSFKTLIVFSIALIPMVYIIATNFLGLQQHVINLGEVLRGDYWRQSSAYWNLIVNVDWILSFEYLIFTVALLGTLVLAYGRNSLKLFPITIALIAGISLFYMIDTLYPYGAFKPLQVLALPTAAGAAVILEAIGIPFTMHFISGAGSTPIITVSSQGTRVPASIAWPCAGVHSLFLYLVIFLLLFRQSDLSLFRKTIYLVIGAVGTYLVNVLRIVTYFVILFNKGVESAQIFHNVYGDLFFVSWMLLYITVLVFTKKYGLIEKTKDRLFTSARKFE